MPLDRSPRASRRSVLGLAAGILALHVALLAWGALRHSPVSGETAYLPAGISHWQFGRFELYRANPPLVRVVAAAPVLLLGARTDWRAWQDRRAPRYEFQVGADFVAANGPRALWLFAVARWASIPFSVLAGAVCFLWAYRLYGRSAALLALALWCFCPAALASGQLITPDTGAAACGVAACYAFSVWVRRPTWGSAFSAGVCLGLAQLAKAIWLVLLPLWPVLWLLWLASADPLSFRRRAPRREALQLAAMYLLALGILDLGYGGEKIPTWWPTAPAEHPSAPPGTAAGAPAAAASTHSARATPSFRLPLPVPEDYLRGLETQLAVLEEPQAAYLRGQWRTSGGWGYYYLYALAVKMPLGVGLLLVLAGIARWCRKGRSWRDHLLLIPPAAVLVVVLSMHTTLNKHFRYLLPALPLAYVWISRAAAGWRPQHRLGPQVVTAATAWMVASSLWIYPHSLSYFNETTFGPLGGHRHLLGTNLDWAQDLIYLQHWAAKHPEIGILKVAYQTNYDPSAMGLPCERVWAVSEPVPPGWYAVGMNQLYGVSDAFAAFRNRPVQQRIAYSLCVYHVPGPAASRPQVPGSLFLAPAKPP